MAEGAGVLSAQRGVFHLYQRVVAGDRCGDGSDDVADEDGHPDAV